MARSDRLFRLLDAFRRLPAPVTAARLAEETGVSERTLYRDIDTLRAGGALIDGARGYGYTLTEDPALPPQMFDRTEIEALVLGLGWLRGQGDDALARAAEGALAKIAASLPGRKQAELAHAVMMSYAYEDRLPVPDHTALLRQCCWDEVAVDITYRDAGGAETQRRVWPLSLVFTDRAPILLAWCCLRRDFRRFIVTRMTGATRSGESFRPRRVPLLREVIAQMEDQRPAGQAPTG